MTSTLFPVFRVVVVERLKGRMRNLCYRNFLVYINKGCPQYKRVLIPRYVVNKIRQKFPEENESLYIGFIDIQKEAIESAAT